MHDNSHQTKLIELWSNSWQKLTVKQKELVSKILVYLINSRPTSEFIELTHKEVLPLTGKFFNPLSKAVWSLSTEEGKLTIQVPNFRFQLSPTSPTKFRPVNQSINLEFEFEQPEQEHPWLMHIYAKGIRRATFEAIQEWCGPNSK